MMICKICGTKVKTLKGLALHVARKHKEIISIEDYYKEHFWNGEFENKCTFCSRRLTEFTSLLEGYNGKPKNFCDSNCWSREKRRLKIPEQFVNECKLCSASFVLKGGLSLHVNHTHKMKIEDYYNKFLRKDDSEGKCKWCGKPTTFSGILGYRDFCYNSNCSVDWHNKFEGRAIQAGESAHKTFVKEPWRCCANVGYHTRRGHSEAEAKKIISERQTTFSKDICIEKHGKEKGMEIWQERQKKWITSMPRMNYSKISQDLFWKIYNTLPEKLKKSTYFATNDGGNCNTKKNKEWLQRTETSFVKFDFYIEVLNRVIEFDGDYWHGESRGNVTRDKLREESIIKQNKGVQILHVKECDYNTNPTNIIQRCLDFLEKE